MLACSLSFAQSIGADLLHPFNSVQQWYAARSFSFIQCFHSSLFIHSFNKNNNNNNMIATPTIPNFHWVTNNSLPFHGMPEQDSPSAPRQANSPHDTNRHHHRHRRGHVSLQFRTSRNFEIPHEVRKKVRTYPKRSRNEITKRRKIPKEEEEEYV